MRRTLTLLLGSAMTIMAGTAISPALPAMQTHFALTPNSGLLVRLVLTIPALAIALFSLPMGWLLDKIGRRPIILFSLFLFGISGVAGFFLDSLPAILISRVLQGMAVAGIMPGFTTLIGDFFHGTEVNKFMGLQATFMGFGGVLFLLLGGVLADVGWRFPFLAYAVSFFLIPMVFLFIQEPEHKTDTEKQLSLSEIKGGRWKLGLTCAIAILSMMAFYMVPVQVPFLLSKLKGISNTQIGIALASLTLVSSLVSLTYKRIRLRFSFGAVFGMNFFLMGLGYIFLSRGHSYFFILGALAVSGLGMGLLLPNLNSWVVSFTSLKIRGRANGLVTSFLFLGQFLSPIAVAPLIAGGSLWSAFFIVGILLFLAGIVTSVGVWFRAKVLGAGRS